MASEEDKEAEPVYKNTNHEAAKGGWSSGDSGDAIHPTTAQEPGPSSTRCFSSAAGRGPTKQERQCSRQRRGMSASTVMNEKAQEFLLQQD